MIRSETRRSRDVNVGSVGNRKGRGHRLWGGWRDGCNSQIKGHYPGKGDSIPQAECRPWKLGLRSFQDQILILEYISQCK